MITRADLDVIVEEWLNMGDDSSKQTCEVWKFKI